MGVSFWIPVWLPVSLYRKCTMVSSEACLYSSLVPMLHAVFLVSTIPQYSAYLILQISSIASPCICLLFAHLLLSHFPSRSGILKEKIRAARYEGRKGGQNCGLEEH